MAKLKDIRNERLDTLTRIERSAASLRAKVLTSKLSDEVIGMQIEQGDLEKIFNTLTHLATIIESKEIGLRVRSDRK